MTSVERVKRALAHEAADRVPVDFGSTHVTGISVWAVIELRKALLGEARPLVKVVEPYQMLGEIADDLRDALGIDVAPVTSSETMFGFWNKDWKPFTLPDGTAPPCLDEAEGLRRVSRPGGGTEVLVPGEFNVTTDAKGDLFIHPGGDLSVPPSGRMPKGGYYFDAVSRQEPLDEATLDPKDNLEEFGPLSVEVLDDLARQAKHAASSSTAAVLSVPGTAFGDVALVPALWLKHPRGIRDVEEWYVATLARRDYVTAVFEGQLEFALKNLEVLIGAIGDDVQVAFVTGTDFGTQRGPFISPQMYRDLYKPFHKQVNDFIHAHSTWKTFIHSCGSVVDLIPDFIDAGFDILNPVQCSAADMDPLRLKREFGKDLVFWGGGVETQQTLAFGTPDEVHGEVRERIRILGEGGGFVFTTVHNIQAGTPIDNLLAMFKALREGE
jgi:hypothetical protein